MEKQIITKLEKLDEISRKRCLSRFPSYFPDEIWNGHWKREETLLKKELEKIKNTNPEMFWECVEKADVQKYVMSSNIHDGRVGLNTEITPEGGGLIAQTSTEDKCIKIAFEVYGINSYFID